MRVRPKVLLLNPPGSKIFIRDYYCSKVSKAYYLPQPVDLLMQSAFFNEEDYHLHLLDCIADKVSLPDALSTVNDFKPDLIIGLIGSVSLEEDEPFYNNVKSKLPQTRLVLSGDVLIEEKEEKLRAWKWLDGIISNFFFDGVKRWFEGEEDTPGFFFLQENRLVGQETSRDVKYPLPSPRQELFLSKKYRMPFATRMPMATVLTNYACPFPCTFCIMSTMPYSTRTFESIIAELEKIKSLGYKYIYFSDQTFFMTPGTTKKVLEWMIEVDYGIQWMCFSRVDVLDEEKLKLMKKAGCNLIMFGVEWAEEKYLSQYKKNYNLGDIKRTFELSKNLGLKRLGTFLIGVPGQSEESIKNTVRFALDLEADYASFNVAVPRENTSFREEAIEAGIITTDLKVMDQSGDEITMGTGLVSRDRLGELKREAYRSFYFRPSYLLSRLLGIRTMTEFQNHVREGVFVLKGILKN